MKKIEIIKKLLVENINSLNRDTSICKLSIGFKDNTFYVVNHCDNEVILTGDVLNYDVNFNSQKKFILDVVNSVASFVDVLEDIDWDEYFKNLINVNGVNYIEVIGFGDIFRNNFIKLELNDEDINFQRRFKKLERMIENGLDNNKIRVVYCKKENGFYVGKNIYESKVFVTFIEDTVALDNIKEVDDDVTSDETITLYYSLTSEKELKEAIKFIKNVMKNFEKQDS